MKEREKLRPVEPGHLDGFYVSCTYCPEQEFTMDARGTNQFLSGVPGCFWSFPMNWRNLYIEAIVKEIRPLWSRPGGYRKEVNTLALKGTLQRKQIQPSPGLRKQRKESAADKAQKLMLTWLVNYPGIFEQVENTFPLPIL